MNAILGALVEPESAGSPRPLSQGSEWTFELIQSYDDAISQVAREYGLDTYPNQIEVITSEQMLDAYASAGLPIGYPQWSYGCLLYASPRPDRAPPPRQRLHRAIERARPG